MQITKSVTLPSGEEIGYWNVTLVVMDPAAQNAQVSLAGYLSKSYFDDGHAPATSRTVEMPFTGLTAIPALQTQVASVLPDLIV